MNYILEFIESVNVPNSKKVVRHVLQDINVEIDRYDQNELEALILDLQPNSPKAITTACYVIGLYAKWLQEQGLSDDTLLKSVQAIDKNALWKKAKPNAKKKFISYEQYQQVLYDIERYQEFNSLYYKTLFQCIYEGVYNDDLSVIKNLRPADIIGNVLTLREGDGHVYKLKVSSELAANLKELSTVHIWERLNRYGICRVEMKGTYADSVFKVEYRKRKKISEDGSYKFSYYAKLRRIGDEYLEHSMLPFQLYTSGIMYRIIVELEKHGISHYEAFADNSRSKVAHEIIAKELLRCNYKADIGNFRELVKGHLDAF